VAAPRTSSSSSRLRTRTFNLALQFRKSEVERDEIIAALRSILHDLESAAN
jgi:hypothetical protein